MNVILLLEIHLTTADHTSSVMLEMSGEWLDTILGVALSGVSTILSLTQNLSGATLCREL